jgi:hypothetical protein
MITIRKVGLDFLQQHRRPNVALTRAIDALFIIANVQANLEQTSVATIVAEKETLDPETQELNIEEL